MIHEGEEKDIDVDNTPSHIENKGDNNEDTPMLEHNEVGQNQTYIDAYDFEDLLEI